MRRIAIFIMTGLVLGITEAVFGWFLTPANFLGYILIFIGLGYCIGGSIFLAATRPKAGNGQQKELSFQSDRTLLTLAPGALLILLAVPLEYTLLPAALPRTKAMQWIGLAIILTGLALRIWVRRSLKVAYQGNLQVQHKQQLVTGGPYQWIRHPGYLAFLLQALGLSLGFSSLSGLIGLSLLVIAFRYRMQVEEDMMVQAFGNDYIAYANRTHRLIPGIW